MQLKIQMRTGAGRYFLRCFRTLLHDNDGELNGQKVLFPSAKSRSIPGIREPSPSG
jgi:hypothetical protein